MKIEAKIDEFNLPILVVEEGKTILKFDLSETTKRSLKPKGLYDVINVYLKENKVSERVFIRACRDMSDGLNDVLNSDNVYETVRDKLADGVRAIGFKKFLNWFRENHKCIVDKETGEVVGELYIPETVEKSFTYDPDKGETAEKTYIYSEFVDLIALVLFMRLLFPVYNDYLTYLSKSNRHPYYTLFKYFSGGEIDFEGGPMDKLRSYIDANYTSIFKGDDRKNMVVNAGLSDDDVVEYLAGSSIFNKLLTMDFFNSQSNPISRVFSTVRYEGRFNTGGNNLYVKKATPDGSDEDYSFFENFRKTTSLAQGTVIELQHALNDEEMIVSGLGYDPKTFDWEFYRNELTNVGVFMKDPIDEVKVYLLGWFLKNFVNPRALFYIEQRKIVELLLLAKTCLYQSGQEYIGTFLVSTYDSEDSFINPSITARNSLNKALLQRLESLFTYSIDDKGPTYAKCIVEFGKQITNQPWKPKGAFNSRYVNNQGYLIAPGNINEILVDYVEFILNLGKF